MTRYADPLRCPDCRAAIATGAASCGVCALSLRGETAQRLFHTLSQADDLLTALRAASVPSGAEATASERETGATTTTFPSARPPAAPGPFPTAQPTDRAPRPGLSSSSVPKILLGLGAGCLLVAALVFLAVTWSVMGVGGRTATLVALTAVAGGLAAWMARRGLRAATESLALVGYGLLTLDLVGAENADWFGDLSSAGFLVLLGVMLALTGAAGAVAARQAVASPLVGGEVVCAIGTALVAVGIDSAEWMALSPSLVVATLVGVAATVATHRLHLRAATAGAAVVTAVSWLSLAGYALDRVLEHDAGWRELWSAGHPVPLLVSAAMVAGLALVHRLPSAARVGALAVAHLLVAVSVLAPVENLEPTTITLVALGVLVVTGAATWSLPRPWGLANVLTQLTAAAGVLGVGLLLTAGSASRLVEAAQATWSGRTGDLLPAVYRVGAQPAAWLLPLCVVALVATVWTLAEASPVVDRVVTPAADLRVGAAVLAGSLVAVLSLYAVPVWLVLGALLLVSAALAAWWLTSRSPVPLALATVFLVAALLVSAHAQGLTMAALTLSLVLTALVHLRARSADLAAVAGALLAATVAGAVWTGGALLDAQPSWVALSGLLVLGAVVLLAPYAPAGWWASTGAVFARTGLEAGAAAGALPLALVGVALAPVSETASWAAVYLTTAGVAVTVMSLVREDRRAVGWAGGLLLALGSWVRLWDLGVNAPEAYTLPSAAALVAVGLVHLRRFPSSSTMTALAPGLSLALVPSLLWALTEPAGPRALLLGLGCLLLVLAGARLGWTAPIALGAGVGTLLVLRLAAPYVGDAVPRWVLIGAAGALLIAVGATWERRMSEARHLVGYVRALR